MIVLSLVGDIRRDMPLIGTRKLLFMLLPALTEHKIKLGRDQLFELLRFYGLLIRRRIRKVKTTNSHHWLKKYPNLTVGLVLNGAEELWVSDITYVRTTAGFSYLSLITDAYSHKIVGHELCPTLEATGCIEALKMAVLGRKRSSPFTLIHHSDKGVQYCSSEYIKILQQEGIAISMTQNGSPYENALAERANGILKTEFLISRVYQSHQDAKKGITPVIQIYNQRRPHSTVDYLTPDEAHSKSGLLKKRWKNYRKPYIRKEETT